jgi:hypothetical protein
LLYVDLPALDGKPFALLLMGTKPSGEDDWAVFSGIARLESGTLYLDRGAEPRFEIRAEWIDRIHMIVDPVVRETLLNADYCLSLTVGRLPTDDDSSDFLQTGLKWPD